MDPAPSAGPTPTTAPLSESELASARARAGALEEAEEGFRARSRSRGRRRLRVLATEQGRVAAATAALIAMHREVDRLAAALPALPAPTSAFLASMEPSIEDAMTHPRVWLHAERNQLRAERDHILARVADIDVELRELEEAGAAQMAGRGQRLA